MHGIRPPDREQGLRGRMITRGCRISCASHGEFTMGSASFPAYPGKRSAGYSRRHRVTDLGRTTDRTGPRGEVGDHRVLDGAGGVVEAEVLEEQGSGED